MKNIEFINAGAGSGKTFKLTGLLTSNIREGKCCANQVILTTFTEKAAAEFKAKARQALIAEGLPEQANLLAAAVIGTVHGVALQLIKKYWYYLGISPDIKVMPQSDVDFFFNQAMSAIPTEEELTTLREISEQLSFVDSFNTTDYNRWKNDVEDIRKKAINNRIKDLNISKNNSIAEIRQLFPVNPDIKGFDILDERGIKETTKELLDLLKNEKDNPTRNKRIAGCQTLLGKDNWRFKDYVIAKKVLENTTNSHKETVNSLNNWIERLAHLYETECFVENITAYTKLVFDLAKRSLNAFADYKKMNHLVDFDDMEDLFLSLLENEKGRKEIAASFRQVYVDEFQDSSPAQVRIFARLSELADKSYWVGDPKQAIFGFRGTDPALIYAVINRFETNANDLAVSNLASSWRSRPSIVNLCNKLFSHALKNQIDPKYITLASVRSDDELKQDERHYPLQHWHAKDELPKGGNIEQKWHHLAESIHEFINSGEAKVVDKSLSKYRAGNGKDIIVLRDMRPIDIAVLCKTNKNVAVLTEALRGFGLQVAGEQKGLNETTEASLLLAAINYLIDPSDQLAKATLVLLSGKLRSSEEMIDDRLAYLYNENAPVPPTWTEEGHKESADKGDEYQIWYEYLNAWQKDCQVLSKIETLREMVAGTSVPVMIAKLAVEGGLYDLLQRWDNPGQRTANLQALVKKASEYDDRCQLLNMGPSLKGFIRFIESLEKNNSDQSAATGNEAIHVMTYHKAKGLEWPVVILANLEDDALNDSSLINNSFFNTGLIGPDTIDPDNPFAGREIRLLPWPFGSKNTGVPEDIGNRIKETHRFNALRIKETDESNRLLYVGYTRARDILITTSYRKKELKWIKDALNGHDPTMLSELDSLDAGTHIMDLYNMEQQVLVSVKNFETDLTYPQHDKLVEVISKRNDILPEPKHKFISPSKEYYSAPVAVSEMVDFNFRIETGKAGNHTEGELGDCLHSIFSVYKPGTDLTAFIEIARASIIRHDLHGWLTHPGHVAEAIRRLYAFLEETYGQAVAVYHELPLQMEENGQIYRGEADMVWETKDGLILIDFKSYPGKKEHVTKPEHDKYTGRYAGQLFTYKRMLEMAHPKRKPIIDLLVYYAVIGLVVKVDTCK